MSVFHSLIHRLINVPLNKENYNKELSIIKTIALNNGYRPNIVDNLINKKKEKHILKFFYPQNINTSKNKWFAINRVKGISPKITNQLQKMDINIIEVNKNNLGHILVNNKEKTKLCDKSGVYEIKCSNCNAIYIGQTGRCLKYRLKEHKNCILLNQPNTGFAEHCINYNHIFTENNCKLLHQSNKNKRLDYLEILEIKKATSKNKNITNTQTDYGKFPLLDSAIKLKLKL